MEPQEGSFRPGDNSLFSGHLTLHGLLCVVFSYYGRVDIKLQGGNEILWGRTGSFLLEALQIGVWQGMGI